MSASQIAEVHERIPDSQQRRLFAAACAGIFGFGLVIGFLGPLFTFPKVQAWFGGNHARQGSLSSILFVGVLLATPFVGPIIDRFGNKVVLTGSSAIVAASLFGFAYLGTYRQALIASLVLGFGGGGLNISSNALTADVFGDRRGPFLNYLGIFFGIGALFVPTLVLVASRLISTTGIILCSMALPIVFAIAFSGITFPPAHHAQGFAIRDALQVARYPGVMLFAFLLAFESGAEATLQSWSPTFAHELGASPASSSWTLAAYLSCVMLGRILAARLLRNMRNMQLLVISGIFGSAACLFFAFAPNFPMLVLACALVGLATAAIYPTTLAVVGDRYQHFAATVFSFIFTVALIGGWAFPQAAGLIAERQHTVNAARPLPLIGAAAVAVLILIVYWRDTRPAA